MSAKPTRSSVVVTPASTSFGTRHIPLFYAIRASSLTSLGLELGWMSVHFYTLIPHQVQE